MLRGRAARDDKHGGARYPHDVSSISVTSSLDAALEADLTALREADLERSLRTVRRLRGAEVELDGRSAIDFSSNDYLGLAADARLVDAAAHAAREYGAGAGASRLISGNHPEHAALERSLADFFGTEAALSFATGYAANTGIIPALAGRDDAVFSDALNHASLIDGCRLSRATIHVYPHGDVYALRALLARHRGAVRRALIVTDGMFSMDGDLAPLPEIVSLAREHDAWTYVDDAHAVGVLGARGRGTPELLGVEGEIDVLVGTLGKAFGAAGAYVVGSASVRQWLVNRARSFVFSTGPMPAQAAAARTAIAIAQAEPDRRQRVIENAWHLRAALRDRRIDGVGGVDAHIVPVRVGSAAATVHLGASLAARGLLVGAVRPPTVPDGTSRLRISLGAAHTPEHIERLADTLAIATRG
jgi:8-amino-7-oxononanoate synthase